MPFMPAREVQRSDQVCDVLQQAASSDLLVNNLSYHQPEALSLAVQRAYSRQFFQRRSYTNGETAIIDFNSGTDFVDPNLYSPPRGLGNDSNRWVGGQFGNERYQTG